MINNIHLLNEDTGLQNRGPSEKACGKGKGAQCLLHLCFNGKTSLQESQSPEIIVKVQGKGKFAFSRRESGNI